MVSSQQLERPGNEKYTDTRLTTASSVLSEIASVPSSTKRPYLLDRVGRLGMLPALPGQGGKRAATNTSCTELLQK